MKKSVVKHYRNLLAISLLALAALFCSSADFGNPTPAAASPTPPSSAVQTGAAAQLTQIALTGVPGVPPALAGSIIGALSYPAGALPPMRVAALDVTTSQPYYVDTLLNQSEYEIPDIPPGTYYVVAYSLGGGAFPFGLAGGYTAAVPCGLTEVCTSHQLLPVVVSAGQVTSGVHPTDWNGRDLPPIPGPVPATPSAPANVPDSGGSIQGSLSYPSEFIPSLAVVAFRVGGAPGDYSFVTTQQGQETYSIPVAAGQYYVVAYILGGGYAGGYSQAVSCGLQSSCTDHSLTPVTVPEGGTVTGIDPADWYAPEDAFPAYPLP